MSTSYHIVNNPLPMSQNFKGLKKEGLAYIQQLSGNEWTNLNVSDPGVTILDQVCFALTELGYCNEFPIHDILCNKNGKLQIKDQFYLPHEILTTSPVTINDYIRALVDAIEDVYNAVILSECNTDQFQNGIYKVYLLINPLITDNNKIDEICKSAFYFLNDCRNLGELFLMPQVLGLSSYQISGSVTVSEKQNADKVVAAIQEAIRDFIFPPAVQVSYNQLSNEGIATNEIFNGPDLKNGWIQSDSLGTKKDKVRPNDLISVIKSVEGVEAVSQLTFPLSASMLNPLHDRLNKIMFEITNAMLDKLSAPYIYQLTEIANQLDVVLSDSSVNQSTAKLYEAVTDLLVILPNDSSNSFIKKLNQIISGLTTVLSFNSLKCELNEMIVVDVLKSIENGSLIINYFKEELVFEKTLENSLRLIQTQLPDMQVVLGNGGNNFTDVPKGKYREIDTYYSIQNTFPEIFAVGTDSLNSGASDFEIAQSRQLKGYLTLFDQVIANQFSQLANVDKLFSFKNAMTGATSDEREYFDKMSAQEKSNPEYPVPYMVFSPTYFYQALYNVPHIKPLLKDHDVFMYSDEPLPEKELENNSWIKYQNYPYNSYLRGLMEFVESESINLERRNQLLDHLLARHGESPLMLNTIINESVYSGNSIKDKVIFKSLYLQNLGLLSYYRQKGYNFIGANKIPHHLASVKEDYNEKIAEGDFVDFIFDSEKINEIEKLSVSDFRNYSSLELKLNLLFGLKVIYRNYILNCLSDLASAATSDFARWLITERKGFILIETAVLRQYQQSDTNPRTTIPAELTPVLDNAIELIFPNFIKEFNDEFKNRINVFLEYTCPLNVPFKVHFVDFITMQELAESYVNWHNCLIYQEPENLSCSMLPYFSDCLLDLVAKINLLK